MKTTTSGDMKLIVPLSPKRGPDFVHSAELLEAAFNILGRSDGTAIGKAMRSRELRAKIRDEQYRLTLEANRKAKKNPPERIEGATGGHMDQPGPRDNPGENK